MDQTLTDRTRERAYEIWVASGGPHGAAEDHWLAAEREIRDAPQTAPKLEIRDAPQAVAERDIRDAPQTAAERELRDAPQTVLAAQPPMVKKSSRAPLAAAESK